MVYTDTRAPGLGWRTAELHGKHAEDLSSSLFSLETQLDEKEESAFGNTISTSPQASSRFLVRFSVRLCLFDS